MKQLIALNRDGRREKSKGKPWKFFLNLAGTVMPRISVQDMARYGNH